MEAERHLPVYIKNSRGRQVSKGQFQNQHGQALVVLPDRGQSYF